MMDVSGKSPAISGPTTWVGKFGETIPRSDGGAEPKNDPSAEAATKDAATDVSLSAEAKAIPERQQADQAAADKLDAALHPDADSTGARDLTFEDLVTPTAEIFNDEDKPLKAVEMTPEHMKSMISASQTLMVHSVAARDPEAAANLQSAIDNGTVRIRKADDVPGVNTHTTVTYTKGVGGGMGMSTSKTSNPSPEIQAEIDAGHATTMWNINQGDLYITW
jgi:hypothetical protein